MNYYNHQTMETLLFSILVFLTIFNFNMVYCMDNEDSTKLKKKVTFAEKDQIKIYSKDIVEKYLNVVKDKENELSEQTETRVIKSDKFEIDSFNILETTIFNSNS